MASYYSCGSPIVVQAAKQGDWKNYHKKASRGVSQRSAGGRWGGGGGGWEEEAFTQCTKEVATLPWHTPSPPS